MTSFHALRVPSGLLMRVVNSMKTWIIINNTAFADLASRSAAVMFTGIYEKTHDGKDLGGTFPQALSTHTSVK